MTDVIIACSKPFITQIIQSYFRTQLLLLNTDVSSSRSILFLCAAKKARSDYRLTVKIYLFMFMYFWITCSRTNVIMGCFFIQPEMYLHTWSWGSLLHPPYDHKIGTSGEENKNKRENMLTYRENRTPPPTHTQYITFKNRVNGLKQNLSLTEYDSWYNFFFLLESSKIIKRMQHSFVFHERNLYKIYSGVQGPLFSIFNK